VRRHAIKGDGDASAGAGGLGQLESIVPGCPGARQAAVDSKKGLRSKPHASDWQQGAIATLNPHAVVVSHGSQVIPPHVEEGGS
jgi:hypothetical protein